MTAFKKERGAKWAAREELRDKGQFWTPHWVAMPMVRYALGSGGAVYDPAVGAGAFARAFKEIRPDVSVASSFFGCEIDPLALEQSGENGLEASELSGVEVRDFLSVTSVPSVCGIVANPPYIRHHRISFEDKARLQSVAERWIGRRIDGRAGLHVFFLIHALGLLAEGKRLAFIIPADVAEGVFSKDLWRWILSSYRLDAVVRFAHHATPFPGVDTNPLVLLLEKSSPQESFLQITCSDFGSSEFDRWVEQGLPRNGFPALNLRTVPTEGAWQRGVGRDLPDGSKEFVPLSRFARTLRGIATGANEYFFMTRARAAELGIPDEYFVRAVGKTRDVSSNTICANDIETLDESGSPTRLLSIPDRSIAELPQAVVDYIREGERAGLSTRALISQRKPWYKMEKRDAPEFLFAYLGRRNARFIKNDAGIVPLTGFLCVYPHSKDPAFVAALWRALCDERTVEQLTVVGKTYGGGAIKVEPRALAQLPIPMDVLRESGLIEWLQCLGGRKP